VKVTYKFTLKKGRTKKTTVLECTRPILQTLTDRLRADLTVSRGLVMKLDNALASQGWKTITVRFTEEQPAKAKGKATS
jgi:hypothetical protein